MSIYVTEQTLRALGAATSADRLALRPSVPGHDLLSQPMPV